jgi:hypothetical protein
LTSDFPIYVHAAPYHRRITHLAPSVKVNFGALGRLFFWFFTESRDTKPTQYL